MRDTLTNQPVYFSSKGLPECVTKKEVIGQGINWNTVNVITVERNRKIGIMLQTTSGNAEGMYLADFARH